jgi:hypothetical protein
VRNSEQESGRIAHRRRENIGIWEHEPQRLNRTKRRKRNEKEKRKEQKRKGEKRKYKRKYKN